MNEWHPQPSKPENGWLKLWHPAGTLVTLPLTAEPIDYAGMFANVSRALAAGWLCEAPGCEPGEEKEEVGFALRSIMEHDGEETPMIDLYAPDDRMVWRIIRIYLNNAVEVSAFEQATGLSLTKMPINVGGGTIERGKNKQADSLIVKMARQPCHVILKHNPKHDPNETDVKKKKPKRVFVRWAELTGPRSEADKPATATATDHEQTEILEKFKKWVAGNPPLNTFNSELRGIADQPATIKPALKAVAAKYAASKNWTWDGQVEGYVPKQGAI